MKFPLTVATFVALAFLGGASSARADNFVSYTLSGDNGYNLIGIDSSGNVAIESPFGCSASDPNRCFEIFSNGTLISQSDALTGFTPDNGTMCAYLELPNQSLAGKSVCDSGNQVAGIRSNGEPQIIFLSPDGSNLVTVGTADLLFVNGAGDFAFVDGLNDEIREFIPTPEPGTLVLFVTGAVGLAVLCWRQRRVL